MAVEPNAASSRLALSVDGLRVEGNNGVEIVDEVAFCVRRGELLALVGESGCGKTTTAMAVLGYARTGTRIVGGSVSVEAEDILRMSERSLRRVRGARISYVSQDPGSSLNPRHRIGRQIAESLRVHGREAGEGSDLVRTLLERVQLPSDREFSRRYPFELSGGQQQRVAIAMALACGPAVVILDEPTTSLDVTTQAEILAVLEELKLSTDAAFVYVTHDLAVIDRIADRVAVMYAGRIVETGPCSRVFDRPAHPYTSLLLGAVPRLTMRHQLTGIPGIAPPPGGRPTGCSFAPRCPAAVEQCRRETPSNTNIGDDWAVRCWRASEVATVRAEGREAAQNEPGGVDVDALLAVEQLSVSYGRGAARRTVVRETSFKISSGSCVALVGESGSGKTTIGRSVVGLIEPDDGEIIYRGSQLASTARDRTLAQRQEIQIVFQNADRSLNPRETAEQALRRPLRLFGHVTRSGEQQEIRDLLERVRLPKNARTRYPRELSGGERQRLAIARSLAARPALIICDEVTSALDVSIQAAVVTLLSELRQDGLSLLFITHNLALVNSIADEVLVLEAGQIRERGPTIDVIERPSHEYTRELLAAAPELRAR